MGLFKPKYTKISDEELMQMASKGDGSAFSELYDRYAKKLLNYFYTRLWKDREKAEDLVQDIFAKIVHKPELFDSSRVFKTWLYSVANNMCKNEYRKHSVRDNVHSTEETGINVAINEKSADEVLYESDFNVALNDALSNIDDKHSEVFVLRHFQDLSIKEIASILECNEGTVKSRLFNVTRRLAGELKVFNPLLNNT